MALLLQENNVDALIQGLSEAWPPEAEMIVSALEAGRFKGRDHRNLTRLRYRVRGRLRLYIDPSESAGWELFTRDVDPRSLGFVTRHQMPLGYGGLVDLLGADQKIITIPCTLCRCRETGPGWYEGALFFNRNQDQSQF